MDTNKSLLMRAMTKDGSFRIFAADTTDITQIARDLHDLSPLVTIMMSRMISLTALMSAELKSPGDEVTLRILGNGDLQGGIVIADLSGNIKCYPYNPHVYYDIKEDNFNVGKHLGAGSLTVMRNMKGKSPYTGTIPLQTGEIGEDAVYYYHQSAQIPTAINLGVLIDPDARILSAAGIMLQQLPQAEASTVSKIEQNLQQTPNISDLMDMGLSIVDILNRFILKDIAWESTATSTIRYRCSCSKSNFARGLMLLETEELKQMVEGISPVCHYCNKTYFFDANDIREIIKIKETK